MTEMPINYLAVLVSGIVAFGLGAPWYSVFAKPWMAAIGKPREELQKANMPVTFITAFIIALITSYVLANILSLVHAVSVGSGILTAVACWIGFTAAPAYATSLFERRPLALWAIDTGYPLLSLIISGIILTLWK